MAAIEGCEEKRRTPVLQEIKCPECGEDLEVFTRDGVAVDDFKCEKCGHVIHEGEHI